MGAWSLEASSFAGVTVPLGWAEFGLVASAEPAVSRGVSCKPLGPEPLAFDDDVVTETAVVPVSA